MAGKKFTKADKQKLSVGVIVGCLLVCVVCIVSDLKDAVPSAVKGELGTAFSDIGNAINVTGDVIGQVEVIAENRADVDTLDTTEIVRVVDGDTYVLDIDGKETKVRLIGVDTPESVAPEGYRKENTSEGELVSEIVKEKLSTVSFLYIEYDVERTDRYGRTLAYLYFPDGIMVQEWLLENGYADVATYAPNTKYANLFESIVSIRDADAASGSQLPVGY